MHLDEIKTSFLNTQKVIALKYVEHLNTQVESYGDNIVNYIGYRDDRAFEYNTGSIRNDEYPYKHLGNSLALGFDFYGENVWVELINDVNYYVIYIHCQSSDDNCSDFMFEFEKNDKELLGTLSETIKNILRDDE